MRLEGGFVGAEGLEPPNLTDVNRSVKSLTWSPNGQVYRRSMLPAAAEL